VPAQPRHPPALISFASGSLNPALGGGWCPGWPQATPKGPQGLDTRRSQRTLSRLEARSPVAVNHSSASRHPHSQPRPACSRCPVTHPGPLPPSQPPTGPAGEPHMSARRRHRPRWTSGIPDDDLPGTCVSRTDTTPPAQHFAILGCLRPNSGTPQAPASFASWTVKPPTPPPAPLTSSHGGGIDAAAARRGRNESHSALAVPFNRSRREATP
jgi:hypothetical protein